ncbi:hypothetical protein [Lysobacter terrae]
MKQEALAINSDAEFSAAQDLLVELTAKKEQVDRQLDAAWQERHDGNSPNQDAERRGVIESAIQMKPGVEEEARTDHQEWMRRPSILQAQSYKLQLAITAQAAKVELERQRASLRLLATVGADYQKCAANVLSAADALIEANAAALDEYRNLQRKGLSGIPEVQFPDGGMAQSVVYWRDQLAQVVAGINQLAKAGEAP